MKIACFTVDLDRDVNIPSAAHNRACSMDRGSGTGARFGSSGEGADILTAMLDGLGVRGTFFAEARALENTGADLGDNEAALHGLDHEDLTGKECGMPMSREEVEDTLGEAMDIIEGIRGRRPIGFRAPYMRFDPSMYDILKDLGIRYDSSVYSGGEHGHVPFRVYEGITEFPVSRGLDRDGKRMSAYLWPMHEGLRTSQDYIDLADRTEDGVFVLATHTWHMVESRERGRMSEAEAGRNAENVRKVIEGLMDLGFGFLTMGEAHARYR